jgi:hypothetical protein
MPQPVQHEIRRQSGGIPDAAPMIVNLVRFPATRHEHQSILVHGIGLYRGQGSSSKRWKRDGFDL